MARKFDLQDEYKNRSAIIRRRAKTGPFDTSNAIDNKANMEAVINFQPVVPSSAEPNRLPIQLNNSGRVISGTNEVVSAGQNMETARLKTQAYLARNPIRATPIVPTATTQATATADTTTQDITVDVDTGATTPNVQSTAPSLFDRAEEIKARMAFSRLPSRQQQAIRTQQRLAESSANQTAEFQARMKAKADEKAADTVREEKKLVLSQNADKRAEAEAAQKAEQIPVTKQLAEVELQIKQRDLEQKKVTDPLNVTKLEADTIVKRYEAEKAKQDYNYRQGTGMTQKEGQESLEKLKKDKWELDRVISSSLTVDREGKTPPVSPASVVQLLEKRLSIADTPEEIIQVKDTMIQQLDELAQGINIQTIQEDLEKYRSIPMDSSPEGMKKMNAEERTSAFAIIAKIRDLEATFDANTRELNNIAKTKQLIEDSKTVIKSKSKPVPVVQTQAGVDSQPVGTAFKISNGAFKYMPLDNETEEQARARLRLPPRTQ